MYTAYQYVDNKSGSIVRAAEITEVLETEPEIRVGDPRKGEPAEIQVGMVFLIFGKDKRGNGESPVKRVEAKDVTDLGMGVGDFWVMDAIGQRAVSADEFASNYTIKN